MREECFQIGVCRSKQTLVNLVRESHSLIKIKGLVIPLGVPKHDVLKVIGSDREQLRAREA